MNEASWKRLLYQIRDGVVVPVVGPRLLVDDDGGESLQRKVAERLLRSYGREAELEQLQPFRELNEAVSRLKSEAYLQDLYSDVHDAIRELTKTDWAIPTPIRQLSQITDFRLFVTLTSDDLLARSLRQRCAVNEIVHSPKLPISEGRDLPADWFARPGEVQLLYLFGKSRSAPMFAIHDEDVLEYAYNVVALGAHVPTAFLGELRERSVLLLGSDFPDWLRFVLRATKPERVVPQRPRRFFISYRRGAEHDVRLARLLVDELRRARHEVFIDVEMEIGTDWAAETTRRIEWCDYLVVLLSKESIVSKMVKGELRHAHSYQEQHRTPSIFPIRVGYEGALDVELSAYVGGVQHIVWKDPADDLTVISAILAAVRAPGGPGESIASTEPDAANEATDQQPEASAIAVPRCYGKGTEMLWYMPTVEFVSELHRRWMSERGAGV